MPYERLSHAIASEFPGEWYDLDLSDHFWFAWRLEVLKRLLRQNHLPMGSPWKVLDIGCGTGLVRGQLEKMTAWTIDGSEVNETPLSHLQPSRGNTFLYNIEDRRMEFKERYDVIVLFDVIEHIQEAKTFMAAALWHLKRGGYLLVNVPALSLLYSPYDKLVGHFMRYDKQALTSLLTDDLVGAAVIDIRYWGVVLTPLAWLRKFYLSRARTPQDAIALGFRAPAVWVNSAMKLLLRAETNLVVNPPFGASLMALGRK